jgi:serine/threonine-protein kinase
MITPRVRLVSLLARGGMAEVWVAEHMGLGARVAVKFIARDLLADRGLRERFRREANAAARIKSPHVVCHLDYDCTAEGVPFLVMELLEGETLRRRLERLGTLSVLETAEVVAHIGHALGAAHAAGIVHRDVKPDNIFITQSAGAPLAKLVDFGVAADRAPGQNPHLTVAGALIGTPFYLSRERALGASSRDPRSDLWALAVVAYECLTGRLPFGGTTVEEVVESIKSGEWVAPSRRRTDLGEAVDAWFERAFHVHPGRRFESALELCASFAMLTPSYGLARADDVPPSSGIRFIGWRARESVPATAVSQPPPPRAWDRGGVGRVVAMSVAAALATLGVEWLEHDAAASMPALASMQPVFSRLAPHAARSVTIPRPRLGKVAPVSTLPRRAPDSRR